MSSARDSMVPFVSIMRATGAFGRFALRKGLTFDLCAKYSQGQRNQRRVYWGI